MELVKINFTIDYEKRIEELGLTFLVNYIMLPVNPPKYQLQAKVFSRGFEITKDLEEKVRKIIPSHYPYEGKEYPVQLSFSANI